ncbi:MAG: ATP-binding protein [Eubacterium sp.]|nr:ATP-binding protein [Eubacterium sp.]
MNIIGRKQEQQLLQDCLNSNRSEFVVIYGRRRVGKTYLVKEFFDDRFSFYATGVDNVNLSEELSFFNDSLKDYGSKDEERPNSWREAFRRLKYLLMEDTIQRDPASNKRIIFLDELPWMDTPRSGFKPALDHFWNSWASSQKDIILIVCGSATSWIIHNILKDTNGLYNRVTRQIHMVPFSLGECERLLTSNGIRMTRDDIILSYMVFGGIPYYLDLFSKRLSLAQNIDVLLFHENGQLHHEYHRLFKSLFRNSEKHYAIIDALAKKRGGLTRKEIIEATSIGDGKHLTDALEELEQCGFIRKYKNYLKEKKGAYFQIIDPFTLFFHTFLKNKKVSSWLKYIRATSYHTWSGLAFETVCLLHTKQIKQALGISGIESSEYAWRSKESEPGAQIDLVIDRTDNVINICEVKHSTKEYALSAADAENLNNKLDAFQDETKSKKALHLTMICSNGLMTNEYSSVIINDICGNDLFE